MLSLQTSLRIKDQSHKITRSVKRFIFGRLLFDIKGNIFVCTFAPGWGVLRYIIDGDVRNPFLGLKFCSDFFWVRDFGKDFFWGLTKSETQGSRFYVKQLYHDAKTVWNSLELLLLLLFLIGLFWVTFWAVGLFLGQGLA